jgi:hypothetical protein
MFGLKLAKPVVRGNDAFDLVSAQTCQGGDSGEVWPARTSFSSSCCACFDERGSCNLRKT